MGGRSNRRRLRPRRRARQSRASDDKTARIWDVRFATLSVAGLIEEACKRRLPGISVMTRDEMRLGRLPRGHGADRRVRGRALARSRREQNS